MLMKAGDGGPPVFLIPGAAGSIIQLGPLAEALPGTVYGIRPRGLEDGDVALRSVEDMAEHALCAVRAVRPEGPYPLVGYSMGGLVALEMAQRMRAAGHDVPLLVLLDTYPGRRIWPLACHLEILGRQLVVQAWSLRRRSPAAACRDVAGLAGRLMAYLGSSGARGVPAPELVPKGWNSASRQVYVASFEAAQAYRPTPYDGRVLFIRPVRVQSSFPTRPSQVWRRFLGDWRVVRVPGSHLDMLHEGVGAIADEVHRCLARPGREHDLPSPCPSMPRLAGSD